MDHVLDFIQTNFKILLQLQKMVFLIIIEEIIVLALWRMTLHLIVDIFLHVKRV